MITRAEIFMEGNCPFSYTVYYCPVLREYMFEERACRLLSSVGFHLSSIPEAIVLSTIMLQHYHTDDGSGSAWNGNNQLVAQVMHMMLSICCPCGTYYKVFSYYCNQNRSAETHVASIPRRQKKKKKNMLFGLLSSLLQ